LPVKSEYKSNIYIDKAPEPELRLSNITLSHCSAGYQANPVSSSKSTVLFSAGAGQSFTLTKKSAISLDPKTALKQEEQEEQNTVALGFDSEKPQCGL